MGFLHLLWSLIVGFVVGLVARAVVPGADKMGLVLTTLVGIVGSLVGGLVGGLVSKPKEGAKFHPAGFFLSILGAIVLVLIWRFVQS